MILLTFSIPRAIPKDIITNARISPTICQGMLPKFPESSANTRAGSSRLTMLPEIESHRNFKIQPIMTL